jgi:uncharacterized protein YfaS (alpha-2-macroglobulin family)
MPPVHWLLTIALLLLAGTARSAVIEEFTPRGVQLEPGQVRAVFSTAMVPFGRPEAAAPFDVHCPVTGRGRWADERTWVYDLDAPLPGGVTCGFRLRPDLVALNGERVRAEPEYSFTVPGPRLVSSLPSAGSRIDEDQVFVLQANAPVYAASVRDRVRCEAEGIHEQIGVELVTGEARRRLLLQLKAQLSEAEPADGRLVLLQCRRTLPANARVTLVWGEGVATPGGDRNPSEQRLEFQVRDHFSAQLRCEREHARAGCIPLLPLRLEFTAPVAVGLLDKVRLEDDEGKVYPPRLREPRPQTEERLIFPGPFAAGARLRLTLPADLRDDRGRPLVNAGRFPLAVRIGEWPPLIKFAGDFGILERKEGGVLPITLRNLEPGKQPEGGTAARLRWLRVTDDEAILAWQQRLRAIEQPAGQPPVDPRRIRLLTVEVAGVVDRPLPKPLGPQAFEVVGLPLKAPGYYILEAESRRLGQALLGGDAPMFVRAAALVTNLAVHFKWGPKGSLAWVTRLDDGQPAAGATVAVRDCKGRLLAQGRTDRDGLVPITAALPDPRTAEYGCPLMVSARLGDDLSFALSDWDEGIETWRFGLPEDWQREERLAHSILDRTLVRPGDTVHMKHLLRERGLRGLTWPSAGTQPPTLVLEHTASGQRWFLPLTWRHGSALTDWPVPSGARRGDYRLRLLDRRIDPDSPPDAMEYLPGLDSGGFTVADFRVPLMRASIEPLSTILVGARTAEVDLAVRWQSGGGARGLPVKLRAQLEPRHLVRFEAHPDYVFAQRRHGDEDAQEGKGVALSMQEFKLGDAGTLRARVAGLPERGMPHTLRLELEYADPNGEIQTVGRSLPWWPASVVLGMRHDGWARAGRDLSLDFLAVDLQGRPVRDIPVEARFTLRQTLSQRVRLAGGFYGYQHQTRDTPLEARCDGRTDARGRFVCRVRVDHGGEILVDATARDARGRPARTHGSVWVAGREDWWFAQDNHDRIDLIPERREYQPGETARFQVRMPYRQALALVTVERDGILHARVQRLSGERPVLELKVEDAWAPNVFVSALAVRGRSAAARPTALVDLAKPGFKLGMTGIRVGHRAHALEVTLATDRSTYRVRDRALVRLKVRTPDGKSPGSGTEIALTAVDEGLLELMDNRSWEVLPAMMAERGLATRTFTAQMQVTGKRHYGRKALPAGGGGGRLPTRELTDTLVYWNPSVTLDANGEAEVAVPLNDSLTAFRIVAVAAGESRFGTGQARIASTQDLQIASGLAPLVRQGDLAPAYFTVRNGSDRAMRVEVVASLSGTSERPSVRTLDLAAGEAKEVGFTLAVPEDANRLEWTVEAREVGGQARDTLKATQRVEPVLPVRVQASALYRLDKQMDLTVAPPEGALHGEVRATLAASLTDGQGTLRDHMRAYPYTCLEQRVSQAVALQDRQSWDALMQELPAQLDESGLARFFPGLGRGDLALTAYVLAIAHASGWPLPPDARARMLGALEDFVTGRLEMPERPWLDARARLALRLNALEALARHGRATPALVSTVKPEPETWPTATLIDWLGLLMHSPALPGRDAWLDSAQAVLKARMYYTGRRLTFAREAQDQFWWLLASPDTNAVRGLLAVMELPAWKTEGPRLGLGILARQSRGHWNSTTANAWGSLAMQRYTRLYETVRPNGRSYAWLGRDGRFVDWQSTPRGATAFFPLPADDAELKLMHQGAGQPYVTLSTVAAVPLKEAVQRGYQVSREVQALERRRPDRWSRGDVLRVRLTINAQADMGWVVVEDPIPAGATLLGSGLKRDSALLTRDEERRGRAWPAWEERRHEGYRAYFEYVPRGSHSLEYTVRLNNDGAFRLPPTRVEAMYAPEMHGESPNAVMDIAP